MIPKVRAGSIWVAKDMESFEVTDVKNKDNKIWIFYQRQSNPNQKYNCLEEAFVNRFTEYTNR